MKVARRAGRGQAVVEAALGSFVFVTILIFGIHFAEVGHIWLKVQEAANYAIWESTSRQMHDVTAHEWDQYLTAPTFAQTNANARYVDFDALKSGGPTITQVFTRTEGLRVTCTPMVAGGNPILPSAPPAVASTVFPTGESGISCGAQARITPLRIPRSFLDGNMSNAPHYTPVSIPACAVGRAVGGVCTGRLDMLLDDWGYTGQLEARECALAMEGGTTCENQGYYDQAKGVYDQTLVASAGAASGLATVVSGSTPIDEDFFYMSFRGRESPFGPFTETLGTSHGDVDWETTPFQHPNNDLFNGWRGDCWMGKPCP